MRMGKRLGRGLLAFIPILLCFFALFLLIGCTPPNEVGLPVEERGEVPAGGSAADEGPVALGETFVICMGERREFATQWVELTEVQESLDGGLWILLLPNGENIELSAEETLEVWQGYRFQLSNPYHEPVPQGKTAPCLQLKLSA